MNYRRITIDNETFEVRISRDGFDEWLADRESLRMNGAPDRPPDVDTENLRAWLPHPGEEDHPYFVEHPVPTAEQAAELAFPVLSVSWKSMDGSRLRLLVIGEMDGAFVCHVQSDAGIGFRRDYPAEMGPDAVWTDIEEQVIAFSDRVNNLDPMASVKVTAYGYYLDFYAEMMAARADIDRGFINPLPEGPIQ